MCGSITIVRNILKIHWLEIYTYYRLEILHVTLINIFLFIPHLYSLYSLYFYYCNKKKKKILSIFSEKLDDTIMMISLLYFRSIKNINFATSERAYPRVLDFFNTLYDSRVVIYKIRVKRRIILYLSYPVLIGLIVSNFTDSPRR